MQQTRDEITENLTERLCWEVARGDETRIARRLYRKPVVDGVYWLDERALLDDFLHCLRALGVIDLLADVHGTAIQREMVPFVQSILLDGVKTLFGIERINALPSLMCSDEALMQLVGFNAPQVCQGVCQRGAGQRQRERLPGPRCPDTLAKQIVKLNVRDLEGVFNSAIRALAKAGIFGQRVTGMADGTSGCRGSRPKVALTACMRQLLTMLNAMLKHRTPWHEHYAAHS